ncbi:CBM96 family carbohydrate-binding protein [Aquimarina agarivorans]|uniref:CBM96 family carbohydrate-binding protein n=1 Tax=Aquimarina agarivorans TaxID=980584 RepID=UPI000248E8E2|nr:T9SS type A sorting domain-containing protein [Aquimarina agarivorans]
MKKKLKLFSSLLCATICCSAIKAQRPTFNKSKDVLIAQFDSKPDPDDIHAQAALGSMLAHNDFNGVNAYGVAGAIGKQGGKFIDSDQLFNLVFGPNNWTDADANWNASVTKIVNKVLPILNNGGKVWVQEAGQSDITADWVARIIPTVGANTVKRNVIVVQHSKWNQDQTTSSDLNYVRNRTNYFYIDDGNADFNESWGDHGPYQTPRYRARESKWITQAKNSANGKAKALWREADRIVDREYPNGVPYDWSWMKNDGVDFSDCTENWWIFNIGNKADNISKFWSRYVTNTTGSNQNPIAAPTPPPAPQPTQPVTNPNDGNNCKEKIFEETNGVIAVEAEDYFEQTKVDKREWFVLDKNTNNTPKPDPDGNHADTASNGKYLELLPDTRVRHADPLVNGVSFSNTPGQAAIVSYRVNFKSAGKYFVWVRAFSTGSEDNGIHVGLDGKWPASGARMQWCAGKNQWTWESKQRTGANHCGEARKIFLNVPNAGLHTVSFSMREDGFEIDKFVLSKEYKKPSGQGVAAVAQNCNSNPAPTNPTTPAPAPQNPVNGACSNTTLVALSNFNNLRINGFSPAYKDNQRRAIAINAAQHKDKFAAAEANFSGNTGTYNIKLNTLAELDGESTYRLKINGKQVGTYTNPETNTDYSPAGTTFNNVSVKKGDKIRVEFSSHTNGKIPENGGTAFSRGRWTGLDFICTATVAPVTPPVVAPTPVNPPVVRPNPTPAQTTPDAIGAYSPIHDAYLDGSRNFNINIVRIEGGKRTAYLLFDLSKVSGTVNKANLEFTVNGDGGNGTIKVYKGASTNWTETNLSTSNAPRKGKELGQVSRTFTIGNVVNIPLTAADINKGKIALLIEQTNGNDFAFASKESGNATAPKLILDVAKAVVKSAKFNANQDAFMQGTKHHNTTVLRTENGTRTTYIKFDLRNVATINNATLELTVDGDAGNGTIDIYQGSDKGWTEQNLNSSNEPTTLKKLGSTSGKFAIGNKVNIKLNGINKQNFVTLIIKQTSGNDVAFASKENGNKGPKLALNYTERNGAKIGTQDFDINVEIYPNPTVDKVTVNSERLSELTAINVYDLNGTLLDTVNTPNEEGSASIDLSGYSQGIYLLSLQSDTNKLKIVKVVKK